MLDLTRTTTQLLDGLHDEQDVTAWEGFDARYRPILQGFARRLGCSDADAADVAQETLARFLVEYRAGKYDRGRGRLRSWLLGIARYRVADLRRSAGRKREFRGESAIVDLENDAALTRLWDEEQRSALLRLAVRELRETTRTSDTSIQAFEMLTTRQMAPAAVAEALGISRHDVYLAKSRVAERLRDIIGRLDTSFEEP